LEDAVRAAYATAASRAEPLLLAPRTWEDLTPDELHTIVAGTIDAVFYAARLSEEPTSRSRSLIGGGHDRIQARRGVPASAWVRQH
jgi:hypothetical protein